MEHKRYTTRELERALDYMEKEVPLEKASFKLNRTPCGLAYKLFYLSQENPTLYNSEKIWNYVRTEIRKHRGDVEGQKKRWHERQRKTDIKKLRVEQKINNLKFINYLSNLVEGVEHKQNLAYELGVSPSLISHYLAGKRNPSKTILMKIANKKDMSYNDLISCLS